MTDAQGPPGRACVLTRTKHPTKHSIARRCVALPRWEEALGACESRSVRKPELRGHDAVSQLGTAMRYAGRLTGVVPLSF
jgi:hypothetical protein